ncbi:MAG: OmpA family protein [Gammaproteobacteria bacterium]|nr:MAG: OmpA family protein [Gammaproteobacteria bacterium]
MRRIGFVLFVLCLGFCLGTPKNVNAQFWQKLVDHVEKKVASEAENRANKHTDKAVDSAFDTVEDSATGAASSEENSSSGSIDNQGGTSSDVATVNQDEKLERSSPNIEWAKFDFVPGDEIIFEDGPGSDEENGEFPSRWDLKSGNVEIAEVDGEPAIIYLSQSEIVPYLKKSNEDYLPEVFTVEFDAYFAPLKYNDRYYVYFYDRKNQKSNGSGFMTIYVNNIRFENSDMNYPGKERGNRDAIGGWRHISIAFTKGKLKTYLDDTRLINIPHYEKNPSGITIAADEHDDTQKFIKNIRIAKGGVKYYDRFLSEGKIIVNGIRFDVNKSNIRPESNGAINKIFKLMQKHSDVKFSVEGHTDSDGDDNQNLELSKSRAKAVADRLVSMGIDADRLKSKGWGEARPIQNNDTPEGKATNRRVEFVKI